jgi:hypothetical protein
VPLFAYDVKPAARRSWRGAPRTEEWLTDVFRILLTGFDLAFLVAWRAIRQRWSFDGEMGLGGVPSAPRRQPGFTGNAGGGGGYKSWPCSRYDVDCVVEEWSYY